MTVISIDWSVKPARFPAEKKNDNVEWENLVFLTNLNSEKWVAPNVTAKLSARNFLTKPYRGSVYVSALAYPLNRQRL